MKNITIASVILVGLILMPLSAFANGPANMLPNGDFAQTEKTGNIQVPVGWKLMNMEGAKGSIEADFSTFHTQAPALKVINSVDAGRISVPSTIPVDFAVLPDQEYKFQAYVKGNGEATRLAIIVRSEDKKWAKVIWSQVVIPDTEQWSLVEVTAKIPAQARTMETVISSYSKGTFYWDDATLTQVQ